MSLRRYFATLAWIDGAWARDVVLDIDAQGDWSGIASGQTRPPAAEVLAGPVLPALVNAHSHAFQRAFVGLAERRDQERDDFWSWRDRMYGVALRITPAQLTAIAAQLYLELLRGGYTHSCEFHYLQHQPDGTPYADPLAMGWALAEAAASVGVGLTLLPALYAHAGFTSRALRADQRRFATDAAWVAQACREIGAAHHRHLKAGVAVHSLRAAHADDLDALQRLIGDRELPVHIHVAEQQLEVREARAALGQSPIAWLSTHVRLDPRWQLVHATHATPDEISAVAASGAGLVLCPGTEANLGDGLCDLPAWLAAGVPLSVGSDSQVTRSWIEELRWLEYGQRLGLRARNVAAAPGKQSATAARLFDACVAGSARPAGLARWGLVTGARADFLVLDRQASGLLGLPDTHLLDGLVFGTQDTPIRAVYVAGEAVLRDGRHPQEAAISAAFAQAMVALHDARIGG